MGEVKCRLELFRFLKTLNYSNRLELQNTFLDQTFYDALPELDQLTALVTDSTIRKYDFLLKMPLLEKFITDGDSIDFLDLAGPLSCELEHLTEIQFYVDKELVYVEKVWHCGMFYFSRCVRTENGVRRWELMGLDDLLREINLSFNKL